MTSSGAPGSEPLAYAERPAEGAASGLLVLHHGRGSDEQDLLGLADALDPERRLHVVTPRAPLSFPGSPGFHWYIVPRVGHPDPDTFRRSVTDLGAFHDALWRRTGISPARTVLGGFSQGSVMSYALGLTGGRPTPAGLLIFSGFVPVVEGWEPAPETVRGLPVFVAHGRADPIMSVSLARRARERLSDGGAAVEYHESAAGHFIDPAHLAAAHTWLDARLPAVSASGARR
ncbi:MAG TPA: lipase family protein [Solirubrobacteraceae bacterium]|nr:lipase family protein [Solirubrobacteraceae bacterium]